MSVPYYIMYKFLISVVSVVFEFVLQNVCPITHTHTHTSDCVEVLLATGCRPDVCTHDDGLGPLHLAALHGHTR